MFQYPDLVSENSDLVPTIPLESTVIVWYQKGSDQASRTFIVQIKNLNLINISVLALSCFCSLIAKLWLNTFGSQQNRLIFER